MKNSDFDKNTDDSEKFLTRRNTTETDAENKKKTLQFICRCSLCFIAFIGSGINSLYSGGEITNPKCVEDSSHIISESLNDLINKNSYYSNMTLGVNSILLDLQILVTIFLWIKEGKNWRPIISFMYILLLKFVMSFLFYFNAPQGMYFIYPGVPSISVSYTKSSDFFFSGSAAVSLLCIITSLKIKKHFFVFYGIFVLVVYSLTSIFFRFHYIIDIISALVIAHYCYYMSKFTAGIMEKLIPIKAHKTKYKINL